MGQHDNTKYGDLIDRLQEELLDISEVTGNNIPTKTKAAHYIGILTVINDVQAVIISSLLSNKDDEDEWEKSKTGT